VALEAGRIDSVDTKLVGDDHGVTAAETTRATR